MSPFASLRKERFEPLNELLIVGRTGHGHATEDVPPDAHQSLEATALLLPDAHAPAHRAQQCADVWWQVETEGQGHVENGAVLSLRANPREFLFFPRLPEQGFENDITSVTRQHFGGTRVANQCLDDFLFRLRMPVDRTPPDIRFATAATKQLWRISKPGDDSACGLFVDCLAGDKSLFKLGLADAREFVGEQRDPLNRLAGLALAKHGVSEKFLCSKTDRSSLLWVLFAEAKCP